MIIAAKKAPNPVDKHVGTRVRMRRKMLNMSQEYLGERLGITFQQVQKYENGTNRISASRLQQAAEILQVAGPVLLRRRAWETQSGWEHALTRLRERVRLELGTPEAH